MHRVVMKQLRLCCVVLWVAGCSGPMSMPDAGLSQDAAKALRDACTFSTGALTAQTLSGDSPQGAQIPIEHVVLVMQENRSFDSYFSKLSHGDVLVASPDATNPDATGTPVKRFHQTKYCTVDTHHGWDSAHAQSDDGKNDGFVIANDPMGARAMGYYDETDLPYYYGLARTFAISDHHFASVMGPTQPNRLYYWAATSFGSIENTIPPVKDATGHPTVSMFSRLNAAHLSWKVYATDVSSPAVFVQVLADNLDHFEKIDQFALDVAAGTLPQVSIVEARFNDGQLDIKSDEHPNGNIQLGQQFTASAVNAVMNSELWKSSVIFFSYDEHGGFYDSVPPPRTACIPDDLPPYGEETQKFDHYGFRVPLIAISPYAKRGYVSHTVSDHTSIFRFLSAKWGLPAMTRRDANADALLDLFDFAHPDFSVPTLPDATVNQAKLAECLSDFPP